MSDTTLHNQEDDHEAQILEVIHARTERAGRAEADEHPAHPTQRDIAHAVGLSLGMTNAILKRLTGKGFVTMKRINGRNIHYLVTPSGIEMIAKRSYRYLRRTVGHIVRYKERFSTWLKAQKEAGVTTVVLAGSSDVDFLVQWCVENEGLRFEHRAAAPDELDLSDGDEVASDPQPNPQTIIVLSETVEATEIRAASGLHTAGTPAPGAKGSTAPGTVTLASILIIRDR